jgi:hypothetical protein
MFFFWAGKGRLCPDHHVLQKNILFYFLFFLNIYFFKKNTCSRSHCEVVNFSAESAVLIIHARRLDRIVFACVGSVLVGLF